MAFSEFRLFFDNEAADEGRLAMFEEIKVEQAIDMLTEAQLMLPIGRNDDGDWPEVLDEMLAPLTRVRVEVMIEDDEFTPLIDGIIVAQRFEMAGGPNESQAVVVVHDDSTMMNRNERSKLWSDMSPEAIASQIFDEYEIEARVDSSGIGAPSLERVVSQCSTDYALLRRLARQANMVVSVEPGDTPGQSVGHFRHLPGGGVDLPEMILSGECRNVNKLVLELDALAPVTARGEMIDHATLQTLSAESIDPDTEPLGTDPVAGFTAPAEICPGTFADDRTELEAGVQAAVDRGAWAYSGEGEVDGQVYTGVLAPFRRLSVMGAGSRLSGEYLISEVTHTLRDQGYKQNFVLRRNAHDTGGGGNLLAGVF